MYVELSRELSDWVADLQDVKFTNEKFESEFEHVYLHCKRLKIEA